MLKYILVPISGTPTDNPVFATALSVARLVGAHLEFLHVRQDVQKTLVAMASADMGSGAGYDQMFETIDLEVATRQKQAETAFRDFCERERLPISSDPATDLPSAELRLETGEETAWLAAHGHSADLLVVGRAREGEAVAIDLLETCLLGSGRPVLIAPEQAPGSRTGVVAIAWKDRPEAAKAVAAALPFIEAAERVIIFSVDEGTDTGAQSTERLRHALSWHNARTDVHRLKPDSRAPVEILLEAAAAARADILVMGGYSHSRMREVIFGGFTRSVLHDAGLPVLMAH